MKEGLLESREEYLLNNFERAINEGWVEIYSQPVVRASNGKVCEEDLFAQADSNMYEKKKKMKAERFS